MMKKFIVSACVATMIMGMAVAASAAITIDNDWFINLKAASDTIGSNSSTAKFGTLTGKSDAKGTEDTALPGTVPATAAYVCSDLVAGSKITTDMRAPLASVSAIKTWNLTVGGLASYAFNQIVLTGWNPVDSGMAKGDIGPGMEIKLFDANDTLIWKFDPAGNTAEASPAFTKTFAYDGTPINLKLVAAVPEPGSMVAMLSGLVGLVGFGIRRRK